MKWRPRVKWIIPGLFALLIGNILIHAERPGTEAIQRGPRGTSLFYVYNPRTMAAVQEVNQLPSFVPSAADEGPRAGSVYKNLRVLGDVNTGEFTRLMVNMAKWVAPAQGCAACHNTNDFSEDSKYTKVVARRMLQMVRHINADWTQHVAQTGVTCYTCHRGQLVPPNVWFGDPGPHQAAGLAQQPAGKNHPNPLASGSALPLDPFTPFLEQTNDVRVQATTALHTTDHQSIKQTEWTYSLMMFFSQALGVNCDYCHMTRAFGDWTQSPPQRMTAWYGIRMVRDLNNNFLEPLTSVFPPNRLGAALADAPKVNCATCHNGVYKPLFGAHMAAAFPELTGTPVHPVADAVAVPRAATE